MDVKSRNASEEGYEFALENQAGAALHISEDDRRALVTGLALHEAAKRTLAKVPLPRTQQCLPNMA